MSEPPTPHSDEILTTSGGNATAAGVSFQAEVGALFAILLLAERRVDGRLGLGDVRIRSVRFETEAPVDDILVETDSGGWIFVQAKKRLTLSTTPNSEMGSIAGQIVKQYHACAQGNGAPNWNRPLIPDHDRILIAVGPGASGRITDDLAKALSALQAHSTAPIPRYQQTALDSFSTCLENAWRTLTGTAPSDDVIRPLLSYIRVCRFDFTHADQELAVEWSKPLFQDEGTADAAFALLARQCQWLMENRLGADTAGLRRHLEQKGLTLKAAPSFQEDINALQAYSTATRDELSHYEETKIGDREITIDRQCTQAVIASAISGSFLLIGEPGSGKSAVLNAAAKTLCDQGHDVVTLAVDRLSVTSSDGLEQQLGVSRPVREILRNWPGPAPAFVFIDALDATRGGSSEAVFRNLIKDILEVGGRWRVVASIRTFDLRLGEQFRELFRGAPPDAQYAEESFPHVQHICITHWTPEELAQLFERAPEIASAVMYGGHRLHDLALVPFNTRLLADLISSGLSAEAFGEIHSQAQLLERYWDRRVVRHGTSAALCLRRVVTEMVDARALEVNKLRVAEGAADIFDTLLRENVLVAIRGDRRVAFRHHILFDYAASRVYLDPHDIAATAAIFCGESDLGLMLAPALAFALQGLWAESGDGHADFWSAVITIAGASELDPIARSVAARTACEFPVTADDVQGLNEAMRSQGEQRRSAVTAFTHVVGALAIHVESGATFCVAPWCALTVGAQYVLADTIWSLRALLSLLTSHTHASECGRQVGIAARRLIGFALDHPDLPSQLMLSAIGFVADTYLSDVPASTTVLRKLLESGRIRDHGHEDLPWLARKIKAVWEADPDFAVDIYGTVFGTVIDDRRETSIGGSRILQMRSNRQQDFAMAGFVLKEAFPQFLTADPSHAVCALTKAFEQNVSAVHTPLEETRTWTATVSDHTARLAEDDSRHWAWNPNEEHGDNLAALLKAFVERLRTLPESDACELARLVIQTNVLAVIWARLFMVGAQRPADLGALLWPYAVQSPFLLCMDTQKDAIDLIAAQYSSEVVPERQRFEQAAFDLRIADDENAELQRNTFLLRLFGAIGREQLTTAEARAFLGNHITDAGGNVPNSRPFRIEVSTHAFEASDWFRHQGVEVALPANQDLWAEANRIRSELGLGGAPSVPIRNIRETMSSLQGLMEAAKGSLAVGTAPAITDLAMGIAAAGAKALANLESAPLREQPTVLGDLVTLTLELTNYPAPEAAPDQEVRFEQDQNWGFPVARIEAGQAAIRLCQVDSQTAKRILPSLDALLCDPHPAVRSLVAENLTALWKTDRAEMWRLVKQVAETEPNRAVLRLFVQNCLGPLLHADPNQVEGLVLGILARAGDPKETPVAALLGALAELVTFLWVSHGRLKARRLLQNWLTGIPDHEPELSRAIATLRGALVLGYGNDNPVDRAIRQRAQQFAVWAVNASASELERYLAAVSDGSPMSNETGKINAGIINSIAEQLYFGSGAFRGGSRAEQVILDKLEAKGAFLTDIADILHRIGDVGFPATIHHLIDLLDFLAPGDPALAFDLVAHALLGAGRQYGYQFELLGTDRFVQVIGRLLADNRDIFLDNSARRRVLIRCLDVFSEVGWPAARRLVYQLPDLLR